MDQKHEDTATDDGMPEVTVTGRPPTTEEHLLARVHELEEVVHTFLTHQTSVGHDRISSWLNRVKARLSRSTTPEPKEISPPLESSEKDPAE